MLFHFGAVNIYAEHIVASDKYSHAIEYILFQREQITLIEYIDLNAWDHSQILKIETTQNHR